MTTHTTERLNKLSKDMHERGAGFAKRGDSIFNGFIVAEEILDFAKELQEVISMPDNPQTTVGCF